MDAYWGLGLDPEVAARLEHSHELLDRGARIAQERERRDEREAATATSTNPLEAGTPAVPPQRAAVHHRRARRWFLGRSGTWLAMR